MLQDNFSGPEKRRFKRLSRAFVVRVQNGADNDWDVVLIHNISRGGLLFRIESDVKVGAILTFKINIALNKEAIACLGEVIHVKSLGASTKLCEVGVSFTQISEADAHLISTTVEGLLTKERPR